MIEVKNGTIKVAGSKVDLMTDEERHEEVENLMAKLANMLGGKPDGERKETGDKADDEIKKAIDTIVKHFTENM